MSDKLKGSASAASDGLHFAKVGFCGLFKHPLVIVIAALVLRITLMVALGTYHKAADGDHITFGYEAGRVARSIVVGNGFSSPFQGPSGPTGHVMPVYAYLLAGVFKLFGVYSTASAIVILSLNSLFSALTCVPIFYIGGGTFNRTVGNIAAWAWAFYPPAAVNSVVRIWETALATLLVSLILLAVVRVKPTAPLYTWLGLGLLCGLTALTNATIVVVLPFWGIWLWFYLRQNGVKPGLPLGIVTFAFLLCVSPWFVRNYLIFHGFVPFRTNFGLELQIGNNPLSVGTPAYEFHPLYSPTEFRHYQQLGEAAYVADKKRQAFQFIARYPGSFIRLTLLRISYMWTYLWRASSDSRRPEVVAAGVLFGVLQSFFTFLGLTLSARSGKKQAVPFGILLMLFPMVYYVTTFQTRYRHPIEPLMLILSVYALRSVFYGERADATKLNVLTHSSTVSLVPTNS